MAAVAAAVAAAMAAAADAVAREAADRELRRGRGAGEVRVHDEQQVLRPRDRRRPGEARVAELVLHLAARAVVAQLDDVDRAVGVLVRRAAHDEQPAAIEQQAVTAGDRAAVDRDLLDLRRRQRRRGRRRRLRRVRLVVVAVVVVLLALSGNVTRNSLPVFDWTRISSSSSLTTMPLRLNAAGSLVIEADRSIGTTAPPPAFTAAAGTMYTNDFVESVAKTFPCESRSRSLMNPPPVSKTTGGFVGFAMS